MLEKNPERPRKNGEIRRMRAIRVTVCWLSVSNPGTYNGARNGKATYVIATRKTILIKNAASTVFINSRARSSLSVSRSKKSGIINVEAAKNKETVYTKSGMRKAA